MEAANGRVVYMAAIVGVPVELAVRWLILLMVLTCDPRRKWRAAALTARLINSPKFVVEKPLPASP